MKFPKPQLFLLVLILIVGSIWYLESRKVSTDSSETGDTSIHVGEGMTVDDKASMYERAHEISSPDDFINASDITIMGEIEKGNVVLVDFWTYSCINCQRTLPFLKAWHEKYADQGLTIIGLHTPEFEFEQELVNVQRAVDQFEIPYPVVLDNDFSTWRSYQNRFWPRKYLVDIDGFVVYDRIGEGGYESTEMAIVKALEERAARLGEDVVIEAGATPEGVEEVDTSRPRTPEIYFGHSRLEAIANLPGSQCIDATCGFTPPMQLPLNAFALGGSWTIGQEEATLEGAPGVIQLRFVANKVNVVAEGTSGPVTVEVLLDGKPIDEAAGVDVIDGMVSVDGAGLYNVVDLKGNYGEHILELRINDTGFSIFTFTFG